MSAPLREVRRGTGDKHAQVGNVVERKEATGLRQLDGHGVGAEAQADFAQAYLAYRTAIYSYVRRLMTNEEDAEDLTLAVFEKALRAWDRHPPDDELRPWFFRIATNACLDEFRRRRLIRWQPWQAFIGLFHPSQVAPDNPEEEVLRREKVALVRAALDKLPPRDRAALVMREYHGLSPEEVGTALGISRSAAKTALFRARERLRSAYLQLTGEAPREWSEAPRPVDDRRAKAGGPRVGEHR